MRIKVFLLFISILFAACQSKAPLHSFEQQHLVFCTALQQKANIKDCFWKQGAIFVNQAFYKNRDSIQHYFEALSISAFYSSTLLQHDSCHWFELGYYTTTQDTIYSAIAWKRDTQRWLKELEILIPQTNSATTEADIATARKQWENYSNQHNPHQLVAMSYADSSFYFNDGYIYRNHAAIEEKYQFMNSPKWHIRLSSHAVLQANDSLCLDMGQYISNGKGHYLWCWQRQNAQWKLLLDFNF